MAQADSDKISTLVLNTKLEDDFIAPLTAIRGALELLRDHPDMEPDVRLRFVEAAVRECARLERGVEQLASTVYREPGRTPSPPERPEAGEFGSRIRLLAELEIVDLDFSDYVFGDSKEVNSFYDAIERAVEATGRKWFFAVNFRNCRIWPEAWVAFAHRGKKLSVNYALDTVKYAAAAETEDGIVKTSDAADDDPNLYPSRDAAFAHVAKLRDGGTPS